MRKAIMDRIAPILDEAPRAKRARVSILTPDLPDPDAWHGWWSKALAAEQPTLVIVDSVFEAMTLHNHCLSSGIRLPQDLSMIVMEDTPILRWLNPPPTCYRYPIEKVLRHFRRWVRAGFPPGRAKTFLADLAGGRTFGKIDHRE
jgi:hypothetical protein